MANTKILYTQMCCAAQLCCTLQKTQSKAQAVPKLSHLPSICGGPSNMVVQQRNTVYYVATAAARMRVVDGKLSHDLFEEI